MSGAATRIGRRRRAMVALAALAGIAALVAVGLRVLPAHSHSSTRMVFPTATPSGGPARTSSPAPTPSPTATAQELPELLIRPGPVKIKADGWWSWAMMDMRTGKISGSANMSSTNWTASLIKAWIGADFLRREDKAGRTPNPTRMTQLRTMIRDSNNASADALWDAVGGTESIRRLVSICKLTDSKASPTGGWSKTNLSARDTARMGDCIADGRAAGPRWTTWLINEMCLVRGVGDFGIRKAFPTMIQKTIAIKNGWVDRQAQRQYNVNCLAIGDGWTLAVMTRYPLSRGWQEYGAAICKSVASQLRTDR